MNILCDREPLLQAVANVSRAVSSKSTLQALEGVYLKASGNQLEMTGYDLELGISTTVPATVREGGEIILNAHLLLEMLRKLPSEQITLSSDDKLLTVIQGGMTEYTILGTPAEDFPELPAIGESNSFQISQSVLKSMIGQTLFAVATTDSKPVHTGSLFDLKDSVLTMVSVDGYRMALRKEKVSCSDDYSFIVPGKTLAEASKLLQEEDSPMELYISRKHILMQIGPYRVISRLLEGEFLDYQAAIPQSSTTTVRVNTRSLINSIERTSLLISDRLKSPLRVQFQEDSIKISCSTAIGKVNDQLPSAQTGPDVEMGFNNKYLLDALRACESDEAKLEISGPLSPMKVVPLEGDSFLFLVLPVRLKAE